MNTSQQLLTLLGDGEVHSGAAVAERLGVSRTAVWKQLARLRDLGVEVEGEAGQGYQLRYPYQALEEARLSAAVDADVSVFWEVDSTNDFLLNELAQQPDRRWPAPRVCIADYQTGGRGRRGRRWLSAPGAGLWLSVGRSWEVPPADLPALSLAVGVAAAAVLTDCGAEDVGLKWPNDLQLGDRKLAGILIDVQGDSSGPLSVVAGIGVNLYVPAETAAAVAETGSIEPVGLYEAGVKADRSDLAGKLAGALIDVLDGYSETGFAAYHQRWQNYDVMTGRDVEVSGGKPLAGKALGVNDQGFLIVDCDGHQHLVGAGEVSLRGKAG